MLPAGMNPRSGVPIFPSVSGSIPSRAAFLSGAAKTYFGPGQRPGVSATYAVPTAWPPAGSLLRLPQVVWLNASFARQTSIDPFNTVYGRFTPTGPEAFTASLVNAWKAERTRLVAAMATAKAIVEALRPGRTWVEVIDWDATGAVPSTAADGFLLYAAPPTGPGAFLGTDFLSIWAGLATYDHGSRGFFSIYLPLSPLTADPFVADPKARLVAAMPSFRRHSTRLYHPDPTWGSEAPPDEPPVVPGDGYTAWAPLGGGPSGHDPSDRTIYQADAGNFYSLVAADAASPDLIHAGATSALTSASLLATIAERFGFDPSSGLDLPS